MQRVLLLSLLLCGVAVAHAAPPSTDSSPAPSTVPAAKKLKLAAPGLQHVQLSQDLANFYSDHLAQQLTGRGLQVITAGEIQTLLGFERQKQLLNCSDESTSCMAELANALGVDGLVTGSIGKIGTSYQANLKVLSARDASLLASYSGRVRSEEALLDELTRAASVMARQIVSGKGPAVMDEVATSSANLGLTDDAARSGSSDGTPSRLVPYLALGGGGVFLVGSALVYRGARGDAKRLQDAADGRAPLGQPDARSIYEDGKKKERASVVLGAVGLMGAATGAILLLTEKSAPEPTSSPTVGMLPGGGWSVGFAGEWK